MKRLFVLLFLCLGFTIVTAQNSRKQTPVTIQYADSLLNASAWKVAIPAYESILKTTPANSVVWGKLGFCYHNLQQVDKAIESYNKSMEYEPAPAVIATVQSRLARAYAIKNEKEKAFTSLDKAIQSGYINIRELNEHKDYENIRTDSRFAEMVDRATKIAMPCLTDAQLRQFDFWVGEWDVYPNGRNVIVGHSKIEIASGGCMILENWTALGPVPNSGKSMNYVSPETGKWEQLWVGSGNRSPQKFVNGEYKDGAMRFEFEQQTAQGQKQIGRFIFFNEGPDQVRQFNESSSDNGKTWTTNYDLVYKRKKS